MPTRRSTRKKSYHWHLMLIFVIAATNLQYTFWYGDNSVSTLKQMHQLIAAEKVANEKLTEANNLLKAEVIDLRGGGSETMEERARRELGLIKSSETFYRIVNTDASSPLTGSGQNQIR